MSENALWRVATQKFSSVAVKDLKVSTSTPVWFGDGSGAVSLTLGSRICDDGLGKPVYDFMSDGQPTDRVKLESQNTHTHANAQPGLSVLQNMY